MGGTNVPPIFKIALKIISHRFRVIKVKGLKILRELRYLGYFCHISNANFFQNHEFLCFFCAENFDHLSLQQPVVVKWIRFECNTS